MSWLPRLRDAAAVSRLRQSPPEALEVHAQRSAFAMGAEVWVVVGIVAVPLEAVPPESDIEFGCDSLPVLGKTRRTD